MIGAKSSQCPAPPEPVLEDVDHLSVRVYHSIGRLMHLNRQVMMKTMALRGIQPPEAFALTLLSRNDGISQREFATVLHLSHPRVSMILRGLEESGAVRRSPDETDRRIARVFLTAEGRRREREHRAVLSEFVNRTIGALSEADRQELDRLLSELAVRTTEMLRDERTGRAAEGDAETR